MRIASVKTKLGPWRVVTTALAGAILMVACGGNGDAPLSSSDLPDVSRPALSTPPAEEPAPEEPAPEEPAPEEPAPEEPAPGGSTSAR